MRRRRSQPPQARWVLGVGVPWYQRAGLILLLLVIAAMSGFGEVAALVVGWSTLGAITGLWSGPHGFALGGSELTRAAVLAGLLVWLTFWTAGTVAVAGALQVALYGRDVIELRPGELRAVPRWPRRPVQVATAGIRGVYLLARRGDLMVRTDGGSVQITEMGTEDERATLAAALRELLEVPVTWRPALPANYRTEHRPEGLIIVPGPGTVTLEWLIGPGTVTVRARTPEAAPGDVIFTGSAAELIAASREEDDGDSDSEYLACELVLLGEDARNPGNERYLLLRSRHDPTAPRELGLWLAANAEITLDDQIPELRPTAAAQLARCADRMAAVRARSRGSGLTSRSWLGR